MLKRSSAVIQVSHALLGYWQCKLKFKHLCLPKVSLACFLRPKLPPNGLQVQYSFHFFFPSRHFTNWEHIVEEDVHTVHRYTLHLRVSHLFFSLNEIHTPNTVAAFPRCTATESLCSTTLCIIYCIVWFVVMINSLARPARRTPLLLNRKSDRWSLWHKTQRHVYFSRAYFNLSELQQKPQPINIFNWLNQTISL